MSKAEKTRQFIVEKTAPVFNTKGYAGTSLSDMTVATGLTKGSIYGNFANKDEVALAVFDFNVQKASNIIKQEMANRATARGKLMVYAEVYADFLKYPFQTGGCPILNTSVEADDTHEQLKEKACSAVMGWKNTIVKLIKKGMESKEFSDSIDAEQTALTLIAMIEGAIMIAKVTGKNNYRKMIMQSAAEMINKL
jgi:AcrR family transcriptional regulator